MFTYLFLLLFPLTTFAYMQKDINISDYEFNRYIKPQFKSILQDYQTLLFIINPELKPLKDSFTIKRNIEEATFNLKDTCYIKGADNCFSDIEELIDLITKFKIASYEKIDFASIKNLTLDEKLNAQNKFINLYQQMTSTQNDLENFLLEGKLLTPKLLNTRELKNQLDKITTMFDMFVLDASDNRFQEMFNIYWSSFVKPATINILIKNNKIYFKDQLNDLNIRWTSLNIRLTKRNFEIPSQAKTLLNIMHNRWKNILRIALVTRR